MTVKQVLIAFLCAAGRTSAQSFTGTDYMIRNFVFESREVLPELRLHYYTLGRPTRDAAGVVRNAVMVAHGTTGSSAGFASKTFAGELFGPGQLLDTARYYVVIPDGIGHGQSSKPSDGLRAHFPRYTYNDMVLAQHELLVNALGVSHLRLMIGTSMGCMHDWVWAERYPTFVDGHVALACTPTEIAGRNRWARKLAIEFIRADPTYNGGDYTLPPMVGLRAAQAIINMQASSPKMAHKQMPTRDRADSVAMNLIQSARSAFDANDLIYALDASRNYDPSAGLEQITSYVLAINSADDFINPPELELMERLIPRVKHARYVLLPTSDETRGHGTHSLPAIWKTYLAEFMRDLPQR
jgi:homoserine O-acetyltransferase